MSQNNTPAMVRADSIVYSGLTAVTKLIGIGALAKAQGKKTAVVRAEHYAKQGAALAVASTVTGRGRAAALETYAAAEMAAIVNSHGVIDNHRAMVTVVAVLQDSYTFSESVRADGQRVVKRVEWLKLRDHIDALLSDPTLAKAKRGRYEAAQKAWLAIQARADIIRAASAPAIAAPVTETAPL